MAFECIVQSAMYIFYGLFNIDDEFCCHVWFFMNKFILSLDSHPPKQGQELRVDFEGPGHP